MAEQVSFRWTGIRYADEMNERPGGDGVLVRSRIEWISCDDLASGWRLVCRPFADQSFNFVAIFQQAFCQTTTKVACASRDKYGFQVSTVAGFTFAEEMRL